MANMSRYEQCFSVFCLYSFLFYNLVFAQVQSSQKTTMFSLSQLVQNNTAFSSWNITKEPDPCSWKGVYCTSDNSSINKLSLSGFGLSTSDILPVICQLNTLESLDVSNNYLSSIPNEFDTNCGVIQGLKSLNFSKNKLYDPLPTFNGFVGLETLDMSHNLMRGKISLQLDGLVGLKCLNLSYNRFDGPVPTRLGKSMLLEQFVLSANGFQGEFPEDILYYQNLALIDLRANNLSGTLPRRIGELPKLEVLILSSNNLSGVIPSTIANLTNLTRFAANQNSFSGSIPTGISRFLRNLDLSYNKLNGSIPPDFLSYPTLETVDLTYNFLDGSIPVNLSLSLWRLRLGSNSLTGLIPSATLGHLLRLTYLELDNNTLSGSIPLELGSCKSLALLNLASNKLSGVLPFWLGNLTNLQVLKLQSNRLYGEIPTQFDQLHRLSVLNIGYNSLNGSIPIFISSFTNLTNLNLQENNLRGSIPASIGGLTSLTELQLGKNELSGDVPLLPRSLQIALNLSNNLFEGPIPKILSYLTILEVLDLSNNKFSGGIPFFLLEMNSLTELILSNNRLSGVIPEFSSWVYVNVSGNKVYLVNTTNSPNHSPMFPKKKRISVAVVLMALVASVFAVGILTMLCAYLSRRFSRINDDQQQLQSREDDFPFPQVIEGKILTSNGIHRSQIEFTKAMEAVSNPKNIILKTRFSTYYTANMSSGAIYFVKKLNWSDKIFQLGSHDRFGQELEVLGKLSNSNVMTPLAYVLTTECAYLFYEFAQKDTLFGLLHCGSGNTLDWASRYSIAIGVAQGLAFLHGCSHGPILLLDLSSRSIFLKSVKEPQVGDIELCKVIDPSKSTGSLSTIAGSVGYTPPEYAYTMRVTLAANVYSFGVILLELLTGKQAVSEGIELAKWVLSRVALQQDKQNYILDPNVCRSSVAISSQMLSILKVAVTCVNVSPEARPKMKSVLRMLLNAR